MNRLQGLLTFLYEFVVGDDPLIAVVVVIALAVTAVLVESGVAGWWVTPVAAVAVLAASLLRATRERP